MGLTYYFRFEADAHEPPAQLESFLRRVERLAKELGFQQTMVLNAVFDTPERREFARRLVTGIEVSDVRIQVRAPWRRMVFNVSRRRAMRIGLLGLVFVSGSKHQRG